jgi:uncharacterized protein (DUF1800 family)
MGNTLTRREMLRMRSSKATTKTSTPYAETRINSGLATYTGPWTEKEIIHLLRRTTFGAAKANIDLLKTKSLIEAIDFLVDNPQQPSSKPLNAYEPSFADTQGCAFGNNWVDHIPPTNWQQDSKLGTLEYFRSEYSLLPWWISQLINQQPHVLEKINLFWVNQFSAQEEANRETKALWRYYNTIRTNALGNFRTLLKEITIDPNMLFFLNGHYNTASAPDENYGRELQELFTLGANSGYTEEDVQAAARVLTGWRRKTEVNGNYTSSFDPARHTTTNKQFSAFYGNKVITGKTGVAGAEETDELIDMILQKSEAAKYICRRLYKWFVFYNIDAATEANVITPLADIYRTNNYNIAPVLKALLKSEHFFDVANQGCMIKSPLDLYIGVVREFKMLLPDTPLDRQYNAWRYFKFKCEDVSQNIANPPDVNGWDAYSQPPVFYRSWITSDSINKRLKDLNEYTSSGAYFASIQFKINSIAYNQLFPSPGDPNEVVKNFVLYLLPQDLSQTRKDYMKTEFLLNGLVGDYYWTNAWNTYIANPSDTTNQGVVRTRLDRLINYITSLEEYQLC